MATPALLNPSDNTEERLKTVLTRLVRLSTLKDEEISDAQRHQIASFKELMREMEMPTPAPARAKAPPRAMPTPWAATRPPATETLNCGTQTEAVTAIAAPLQTAAAAVPVGEPTHTTVAFASGNTAAAVADTSEAAAKKDKKEKKKAKKEAKKAAEKATAAGSAAAAASSSSTSTSAAQTDEGKKRTPMTFKPLTSDVGTDASTATASASTGTPAAAAAPSSAAAAASSSSSSSPAANDASAERAGGGPDTASPTSEEAAKPPARVWLGCFVKPTCMRKQKPGSAYREPAGDMEPAPEK